MWVDKEAIVSRVKELIQPLLDSRRTELVELTCRVEGNHVVLRCLVDAVQGITLAELSHLNQAIGALLEEYEVISDRYLLEVNSPGLDRPLKTPLDFERVIGRRIKVNTVLPGNSSREYIGELMAANDQSILLRLDVGEKVQIPLSEISYAVQEIRL